MRLARQRGTTLIVGLLLLTVVMLLGLAGADGANIERQLARNEQFRENAASAASAGIEYAISRIVSSPPPDSSVAPYSAAASLPGSTAVAKQSAGRGKSPPFPMLSSVL